MKVKTGSTETSTTVNAPATSKTISGLSSASTYSTSVSAVNDAGTSEPKDGPDVTPQDPPFNPPTDLSSSSKTTTSVTLAWTKVPGATGYVLSQGKGGDPRTEKTVADVATATFTGLTANTAYTYDIKAVKNATQSAASTPRLTVTTAAEPTDRPTDVHWTTRTASALDIAWNKYPGAVKYKVKYYPTGNSAADKSISLGNVSTASITGLLRGTSYTVRVAGVSASGVQGPYSALKNLSTSNLLPPTNFVKTKTSSTGLTVSWTPAAGAEGYRIYYGIGTGTRTAVEVTGGSKTSKQITGLKPNTTYTIDIASLENDGTSRSLYTTPRISVKTKP